MRTKYESNVTIDPADLLTPEALVERLHVPLTWAYEQTRKRSKFRKNHRCHHSRGQVFAFLLGPG